MNENNIKSIRYFLFPGVPVAIIYARLFWGIWDGYRHLDETYESQVATAVAVWHFRWIVSILGIILISCCIVRLIKKRTLWRSFSCSWFQLRLLLYLLFSAVIATSIAYGFGFLGESRFLLRSFFNTALLGSLGAWAVLALGFPTLLFPTKINAAKIADLVLFNIVITAILLEAGLHIWSKHSSSPMFQDTTAIQNSINRNRKQPYFTYFNFNFNSKGYHDTEFFSAGENDFVVGMIADSFGMGVVPYTYNFTTITEQYLKRVVGKKFEKVAVHNFGIPCIGINEYDYIMRTEVIRMNPKLIVLCIFAGNDVISGWQSKKNLYAIQKWWIGIIVKRLITLTSEIKEGGAVLEIGRSDNPSGKIPEYIFDSTKERPSFSMEKFLEIENERLEICNPQNPMTMKHFSGFFKALKKVRAFAGEKLLIALIPDEFQVNDKLYKQLLSKKINPDNYIRDYPQRRIRSFCDKHNIFLVDLLSDLRDAEITGRTYHLRDTHWNARGNRVAGEVIAKAIINYGFEKL